MQRYSEAAGTEGSVIEATDGEYILYADHVEAMKRIAVDSAQAEPVAKINGSDESYGAFRQLEWLTPDGPYSLKAGTRLYAAPSASAQQEPEYRIEERPNSVIIWRGERLFAQLSKGSRNCVMFP